MTVTWDHFYLATRRFKNRFRYLLRFKKAWRWDGESCDECGCCYRFFYRVADSVWKQIVGHEGGLLCLECLAEKAAEKGVELRSSHFEYLRFFTGNGWASDTILGTEK